MAGGGPLLVSAAALAAFALVGCLSYAHAGGDHPDVMYPLAGAVAGVGLAFLLAPTRPKSFKNPLEELSAKMPEVRKTKVAPTIRGRPGEVGPMKPLGDALPGGRCRDYSVELSKIKPNLDKLGAPLVGVGLEMVGLEEFQREGFWKGEQFVDEKQDVYRAFGSGRGSLAQLFLPSVWKAGQAASNRGIKGNMTQGDGLVLGGVFVIDKAGNVAFEHRQKNFSDHPAPSAVLEAVERCCGP